MLRSVLRRLVLAALVAAASGCSGAGRQLISTGISSYDRQIILDAHNRLRQSVALGRVAGQPGAANMMQMVWDDELASKAQQWADTCAHGHDPGRHVARFKVGQNIARSWTWPRPDSTGGAAEFARQIQNWFNEVSRYRYQGSSTAGTGHYSQLIWGDSYLVGCGYSYFKDPAQGYTKLYVCNYGPGGNIRGYTPYRSGSPSCESFGSTPSSEYSGLCYPPGRSSYGSSSYGSSSLGSNNYGTSSHNYGSSIYTSHSFGTSGLSSHGFGSSSFSSPSFGSHGLSSYSSSYDSNSLGGSGAFGSNGLSSYSSGGSGYTSSPLSSYTSSSLTAYTSRPLSGYTSTGFGSGFSNSGFGSSIFGSSGYNGFSSLGSSGFANNIFGGSRGYWK